MRKTLRRLLLTSVKTFLRDALPGLFYSERSYSQEGEDLVVRRLLEKVAVGFYVDVGAHHPFRFSNTFLFYRRGWRGIVIDPAPGTTAMFNRYRPRDIAVESGVASCVGSMKYWMFNEAALNTFDEALARQRDGRNGYEVVCVAQVASAPLSDLLDAHLPRDVSRIDLLSVDTEGWDQTVLASNDWDRFRPSVVVAESLLSTLAGIDKDPIVCFMRTVGYVPVAKTYQSIIFCQPASDEDS